MNGKMVLDQQQMEVVIAELRELIIQFRNAVKELEDKQIELQRGWEGDSNNTFQQNFNADKQRWEEFAKAMDGYTEVMEAIKNNIVRTEEAAKGIAGTRTFHA